MYILQKEEDIESAQQQLSNSLIQSAFIEALWGKVNCMGGKFEATLYYSPEWNLWYHHEKQEGKFWNAFGIDKPANKALRIQSEINIPIVGINSRLSGAFAQDENGHLYLLHRGNIRGGKALFFQYYQGEIVNIKEGKSNNPFAIIAKFDQDIAKQIHNFIHQVLFIKEHKIS